MAFIFNFTDVWNAAGTTFNGIKLAVTNTASSATSKMIELTTSGATTASFSVDKNGNLATSGTVAATNGIDFSANPNAPGATSETLNDYEEGTWTPTYAPTGTAFAAITMDVQSATYTKVGRQVTVRGFIRTDNLDITGATGDLTLDGLPFTASSGANGWSALSIGFAANWASNTPIYGRVASNQPYMFLCYRTALGGGDTVVAFADMTVGATADSNQLIFTATYFTN